jgi:drug/metabolite transporter (DMT)-like permease
LNVADIGPFTFEAVALYGAAVLIPPRRQGIAELFASAFLFAAMAYLTKKATHTFHGAQIACVRFAVGALVVLAQSTIRHVPLVVVRRDLLAVRGLLGGIAVLIYFVGIERLPVGTATLFNYTSPVFTSVFSWLLLGEQLPFGSIGAMGIALVGVVMVVLGQGHALGGAYEWQILALSSAVISGGAVTAIRAARRTDGPWEVFGAFCVVGAICTAPFMVGGWVTPSVAGWGLLVAVGILAAAAQILMTHALLAVSAASAGVISQVTVVTALALGHFLDGEPLSMMARIGAVFTILGVSVVATR